jgi:multidrug transporter EmrE-like cation transporter
VNTFSFGLVLTGVLLNAGAQLLLKAGTSTFSSLGLDRSQVLLSVFRIATQPHIFGGLICYVLSVGIWIAALSRVPVSVAYPMLSIGYVVNAIAAWHLFGEPLTAAKMGGITLIIVGVAVVARS